MSIQLQLNARVVCSDGPAGRLTDVVLDPITDHMTYLVVEAPGFARAQHLVPVAQLQATGGPDVRLCCSCAELSRMEFFIETKALPLELSAAWWVADDVLPWPTMYGTDGAVHIEYERVPPGELVVRRDTPVEASDGPVGHVDALVMEPQDDRVIDLVLRRGHLWRKQHVVVPVEDIDRIDAQAVHLRPSKARLKALPSHTPDSAA